MRLNIRHLLFLLLLLFTLAVAHFRLGLLSTLLVLSALALADLLVRAWSPGDEQLVLETFPSSIYSEKVRFAMDMMGIEYVEEPDVGIFGRFITGRIVPTLWIRGRQVKVANTSDILRYLLGANYSDPKVRRFFNFCAESERLEARLDDYAHYLRSFIYGSIMRIDGENDLKARNELILRSLGTQNPQIPIWQRLAIKFLLPVIIMCINHELEVHKAKENMRKAVEIMDEFEQILGDGRAFLLKTDEPTHVDVTLAALAGYHAYPDNLFGPRAINPESRVKLHEMGPDYEREVLRFRNTKVGQFVLRMYKEYRDN